MDTAPVPVSPGLALLLMLIQVRNGSLQIKAHRLKAGSASRPPTCCTASRLSLFFLPIAAMRAGAQPHLELREGPDGLHFLYASLKQVFLEPKHCHKVGSRVTEKLWLETGEPHTPSQEK